MKCLNVTRKLKSQGCCWMHQFETMSLFICWCSSIHRHILSCICSDFSFLFYFCFFSLKVFDGRLCDHREWKCSTKNIIFPSTVMRNVENESVAILKSVGLFLRSSEGGILETQRLCRTLTIWRLKVSHLIAPPQTTEILDRKPGVTRHRRAAGKMLIGYKFEMEFLNTCPQQQHPWLQFLTW